PCSSCRPSSSLVYECYIHYEVHVNDILEPGHPFQTGSPNPRAVGFHGFDTIVNVVIIVIAIVIIVIAVAVVAVASFKKHFDDDVCDNG
ncbi:hypothetical protein GN156_30940, partial [bacterium LRH843]|nr:hypothetical protein [bacterium LRH843]